MHKTYLIMFNASRGNRDKFFEIMCNSELKVNQSILQTDGAKDPLHPAYHCYVMNITCLLGTFVELEIALTGFSGGVCEDT